MQHSLLFASREVFTTFFVTVTVIKHNANGHMNYNLLYGPSYNHSHNISDFKKLIDHHGKKSISYFSGTRRYGNVTMRCLMNVYHRHTPYWRPQPRVILHDHVFEIFEKVELIRPIGFRIAIPRK